MKQTILNQSPRYTYRNDSFVTAGPEAECLGKIVVRWALFGVMMWWLWSAFAGLHAFVWLIGLGVAFAWARKELCA
jgi:hypothetical protein